MCLWQNINLIININYIIYKINVLYLGENIPNIIPFIHPLFFLNEIIIIIIIAHFFGGYNLSKIRKKKKERMNECKKI